MHSFQLLMQTTELNVTRDEVIECDCFLHVAQCQYTSVALHAALSC